MSDELTQREKRDLIVKSDNDGELESYLLGVGINPELAEAYVWKTSSGFDDAVFKCALDEVEKLFMALADLWWDGHYTAFRFTSGYKAAFGTPDLRTGQSADDLYDFIPTLPTMTEAMAWAISSEKAFYPPNKGR